MRETVSYPNLLKDHHLRQITSKSKTILLEYFNTRSSIRLAHDVIGVFELNTVQSAANCNNNGIPILP